MILDFHCVFYFSFTILPKDRLATVSVFKNIMLHTQKHQKVERGTRLQRGAQYFRRAVHTKPVHLRLWQFLSISLWTSP